MRNRPGHLLSLTALVLPAPAAIAAEPPAAVARATVVVHVSNLRSEKGQVLACLTFDAQHFPNCEHDPHAISLKRPAKTDMQLVFTGVPVGRYAIALIHDENANGKLDKALVIPREGFGFSRDAPVRMGPPSYDKAAFEVDAHCPAQTIRMRYLL